MLIRRSAHCVVNEMVIGLVQLAAWTCTVLTTVSLGADNEFQALHYTVSKELQRQLFSFAVKHVMCK